MRTSFRLLIAVIVIACAGLVFLQVRLLMNTAELKRTSFDQNVMAALSRTAAGLEELEVVDRLFFAVDTSEVLLGSRMREHTMVESMPPWTVRKKQEGSDTNVQVTVMQTNAGTIRTWVRNGQLVTTVDKPQIVTVRLFDGSGRIDTTLVNRQSLSGEHALRLPNDRTVKGAYFIQVRTDEGVSTMRFDSAGKSGGFSFNTDDPAKREGLVRRVMESFDQPRTKRIRRAITPPVLDSLVGSALRRQAVDVPYEASLIAADADISTDSSVVWRSDDADAYRLPVGLSGPFALPETLAVRFPSRTAFVLTSMWPEITLSVLFIGLIVWMFAATVRTIVRQKEFAARLSDFISNMTHEFKTPLATISLASEALQRPDVRKSGKRIDTYNAVIRDENRRMGSQVERILQMASLEEGDLELRREALAMHDVIAVAAQRSALQVESHGGSVKTELNAQDHIVRGDRVHLENVMHNLLDNAVKYSSDQPTLTVRTENEAGYLCISVRDRGIGMEADQLERVFEKYYRVPTGNVHDVKGFGIGLSYVKLVVTSLGGTVKLTSAIGEGTVAEVRLPVVEQK